MTSVRQSLERMADTELMLRVRDEDECAFEQLYRRYHRRLLDFFFGMCRNAHTADELCHETFARIWQVRRKYAATGSFPAYLFTFARNIWLEQCREYTKDRRLGIRQSFEDCIRELVAGPAGHPVEEASRSELAESIFAALEELPEEQRMVFVMRNIEGLGIDDIATIMQCPPNTVRSRKILAVRKLRESLSRFVSLQAGAGFFGFIFGYFL